MSEIIVIKLGMYIMAPEAIWSAYFINRSNEQYQNCSLSNCIVLLTSVCIYTKVFVSHITYSNCSESKVIISSRNFLSSRVWFRVIAGLRSDVSETQGAQRVAGSLVFSINVSHSNTE
jgi:hypothetical protein